jgi:hypothetical protein
MRIGEDGLPMAGPTARTLGARPGSPPEWDIPVVDGIVRPGTGGMSVSPPPPGNLPHFRRPPEHGGTAKKIGLYEMDTDDLPDRLAARPDPDDPARHVFIEPSREMSFEEYESALEETRSLWRLVQ